MYGNAKYQLNSNVSIFLPEMAVKIRKIKRGRMREERERI